MFKANTALAMTLLLAGAGANANLLNNGSFETGLGVPNSPGYVTYGVGDTGLSDWTIYSGTVDVVSNAYPFLGDAQEGSRFLDLNGDTPGGISQNMTLLANQQYVLTFSYALNGNQAGLRALVTVDPINSPFNTATINLGGVPSQDPIGWQTYSATFTATGANPVKLSFQAIGGSNQGVLLDNVSVTAVPEPGTYAMLLAGLGALAFVARRRKSG